MLNFQNLQTLLNMDFKQLRALPGAGGMRATDAAIQLFVTNLVDFFSQTTPPTLRELQTYIRYMEQITEKINESEYEFSLQKYTAEGEEQAELMASLCKLSSFRDIPRRMQYWAAGPGFGDTIRNPINHTHVVKKLDEWTRLVNNNRRNLFFQPRIELEERKVPSLIHTI